MQQNSILAVGGFSSYLVFQGVLVVLGEVYQDLLFVLLALSFLEENRRSEGIRCAQKAKLSTVY